MSPLTDLNCDFKKELGANVGDNDKEKAILEAFKHFGMLPE